MKNTAVQYKQGIDAMAAERHGPFRLLPVTVYGLADQWVRLPALGFILVFGNSQ